MSMHVDQNIRCAKFHGSTLTIQMLMAFIFGAVFCRYPQSFARNCLENKWENAARAE